MTTSRVLFVVLATLALFPALWGTQTACQTEAISVFETAPHARINFPVDQAVLDTVSVTFVGAVEDGEDPSEELAVRWTTSLLPDDVLHSGFADTAGHTEFTAAEMPLGQQVITLEVEDTAGAVAQDSISITILPEGPIVDIEAPTSGQEFFMGDNITLRGSVMSADEQEFELEVEWVSNEEGPLFSGVANTDGITEALVFLDEPGSHTITLTAWDSYGAAGSDSVAIEVLEYPPGQLDQDSDGYCPDGVDYDGDGVCDDTELTGVGSQDCNDHDNQIYPGAPELCDGLDNDCDGVVPTDETDLDGDGWLPCALDCDDTDPNNFPGNTEVCDDQDNDCDEDIDENDQNVDGDPFSVCDGDCDDLDANNYPTNEEVCDGLDNNCVNGADEHDLDMDGDGVGSACGGDCDDSDWNNYPGNSEACDGQDNDCDGLADYPGGETDADGDGALACNECDDNDPNRFIGNPEVCDGIDNDCSGAPAPDEVDNDSDGQMVCAGDCLDTNPSVYSGAPELCDGLDDNCDGFVPTDEYDMDGDGYRPCNGDCDDNEATVNPGELEVCDLLDNDCDGIMNENADSTEVGESSSTAYGEALPLAGFNHIFNVPFPCPASSCPVFGGLEICQNNISTTGAFASPVDAFDAYVLEYSQISTNFGCSMYVSLTGIPVGHDYALYLYRTDSLSDPVSSWDLLQSSDQPGSLNESLTQGAVSWLDFSTDNIVIVVVSKGNFACPSSSYTLTVVGG